MFSCHVLQGMIAFLQSLYKLIQNKAHAYTVVFSQACVY